MTFDRSAQKVVSKAFRRSGLSLSREAGDALLEFVSRYDDMPLVDVVEEVLSHLRLHSSASNSHVVTETLLRPVLMTMEPHRKISELSLSLESSSSNTLH